MFNEFIINGNSNYEITKTKLQSKLFNSMAKKRRRLRNGAFVQEKLYLLTYMALIFCRKSRQPPSSIINKQMICIINYKIAPLNFQVPPSS